MISDKNDNLIILLCVISVILMILTVFFEEAKCNPNNINQEVVQISHNIKEEFDRSELYWLSMNIYHESRGEDPFGMLMVALVTLDRQSTGRWGTTIREVVTAPYQFSWYSDDKSNVPTNKKSWNKSKEIALFAKMFYSSLKKKLGITHYHNKGVNPNWAKNLQRTLVVGNHIFYKE